jgi:hypothetical protein
MRILRWVLLVVLCAIAALAQDKLAPAVYKGTWAGPSGGGDFVVTIKNDGKGGLTADLSFTVGGEAAVGKVTSSKVDGAKVEIVYDFDVQGTKLQVSTVGTLSGKTLSGTYKSSAEGQTVDEGTWKTTSQ